MILKVTLFKYKLNKEIRKTLSILSKTKKKLYKKKRINNHYTLYYLYPLYFYATLPFSQINKSAL